MQLSRYQTTDIGRTGDLIREAVQQAVSSGQQLTQIHRSEEDQNRIYQRPDETVYEQTHRTIEVYIFQ